MKGAFDSASTIIITIMSVMMIVMSLLLVGMFYSNEGSLQAGSSTQVIIEDYKKDYQAHMTMAALTADFSFRNKTGYYLANGKNRLKNSFILPEVQKVLPQQSSIHVFSAGEETLLRSGDAIRIPGNPSGPAECPGSPVYRNLEGNQFCTVPQNEDGGCPSQSEASSFNGRTYCVLSGEYSASTSSHSNMYVASPSSKLEKISIGIGVQN